MEDLILFTFVLLEATTIPLYQKNKIKLYVHTIDDKVIYFGKKCTFQNLIIDLQD